MITASTPYKLNCDSVLLKDSSSSFFQFEQFYYCRVDLGISLKTDNVFLWPNKTRKLSVCVVLPSNVIYRRKYHEKEKQERMIRNLAKLTISLKCDI